MKIIAAATARNILKDKEKRYDKVRKDINDIITSCANHGEKDAGFHITNLDADYINRLLKEFREVGYIIKKIEYTGCTKIKTIGVYIMVSWAGV